MEQVKPRLIVIGLDGATFDVIGPLAERGKLPHLARIMAEGATGSLQSIIPPSTGPAWSVLATGKNPGQLGVFDFINRRHADDFTLYPIRSKDLAGQTFWDILNRAGYRAGILNYPMLVPAYPIDGWMVGGLGATKLHDLTYPSDLMQKLDEITDGYEITVSYGLPKYRNNLPRLIEDMRIVLNKRLLALEYLLSTHPVDIVTVVFSVSDVASHVLWHCWDTNGQDRSLDPGQKEMRDAYISLWEALDQAVGQVLTHLAPDGHALVISDHGFGPSHGVFHINQWLQQAGYLVRKTNVVSGGNRAREWLFKKLNPLLGPVFKKIAGSRAHQLLRASVLREIDVANSQAFALETSDGCGKIFVNRQYAQTRGLNEDEFVHNTRVQMKQDLIEMSERENLDIKVFMADELYSGDKISLSPDVFVVVNDFLCSISYRFEEPVYADRPHHPMKTGTHRLNGILIATGPEVMSGQINDAQLQDIAPTLLHLTGVPVPESMDGRILTEMFRPEFRLADDPFHTPSKVTSSGEIEIGEEEDEDMEVVLQRLVDLGYLD